MGTVYNHTFISSAVAKVNVKTKVSGENTFSYYYFDAEGHKLNSVESNTQFEGVRSKYKSRKPKLESRNALFVQSRF
jgi:beta-galactosidase